MGSSSSKPSRSQKRQRTLSVGQAGSSKPPSPARRPHSVDVSLMREEARGAPPAYDKSYGAPNSTLNHKSPTSSGKGRDTNPTLREDAFEGLSAYDTIVVVDDSGNMSGSLWNEATRALSDLSDLAARYDQDGIDIYFLNDRSEGLNMHSSVEVQRLFMRVQPRGSTPLGKRLETILLKYLSELEEAKEQADRGAPSSLEALKGINILIMTDGCPTDDPESVIVAAAKRLDRCNASLTQVGIQLVQIGNDPKATAYLQELDDGLSGTHGTRDIVDTTPYTGRALTAETLAKILLGGVNRRVDRRGGASVMS